jgi:hypothetical protein
LCRLAAAAAAAAGAGAIQVHKHTAGGQEHTTTGCRGQHKLCVVDSEMMKNGAAFLDRQCLQSDAQQEQSARLPSHVSTRLTTPPPHLTMLPPPPTHTH